MTEGRTGPLTEYSSIVAFGKREITVHLPILGRWNLLAPDEVDRIGDMNAAAAGRYEVALAAGHGDAATQVFQQDLRASFEPFDRANRFGDALFLGCVTLDALFNCDAKSAKKLSHRLNESLVDIDRVMTDRSVSGWRVLSSAEPPPVGRGWFEIHLWTDYDRITFDLRPHGFGRRPTLVEAYSLLPMTMLKHLIWAYEGKGDERCVPHAMALCGMAKACGLGFGVGLTSRDDFFPYVINYAEMLADPET